KSGLMLIHSRRASERIFYNELMSQFILHPIASQTLLFPIEKELSSNESGIWNENQSLLKQLGFHGAIEKNTLNLTAVPSILQDEMIENCIDSLLQSANYLDIDKGEMAHA